jgi:site-specific recombinase XerD
MPTIKIEMTEEELNQFINDKDVKAALGDKSYVVVDSDKESNRQNKKTTMFQLFDEQIYMFRTYGNSRTGETYLSALRSFKRFRNGRDISPSMITAQLMEAYQCHLRARNLIMNTVSFYMRILRAVYNRAVDRGLTVDNKPFRRVYTGIAKTVKRAVPLPVIKRIKRLPLKEGSTEAMARDLFLFSFYTRGMSFIDMASLTTDNIRGNKLVYTRRKTGQQITIQWESKMQEIVDRYTTVNNRLLPIIKHEGNERMHYRVRQATINRGLKEIARLLKLDAPLTMYVARHSWACVAKSMKIPLDVISQGMGHNSELTTQIYIKELDVNAIDQANSKIINSL